MNGFWLIFEGLAGELDRSFYKTEEDAQTGLICKLQALEWIVCSGDNIRIVDGWSE